jgi:hypothetical protein
VEHLEASRRRPNYLGFQASRGAHHSLEESQIHEFERDLGDLSTWVVLAFTRSTVWHIYWSDLDIFGSRAELLRLFSVPAGRGIFQLGGLALHTAQIFLVLVFMVYSAFGGL